jgi:hypothetical protein
MQAQATTVTGVAVTVTAGLSGLGRDSDRASESARVTIVLENLIVHKKRRRPSQTRLGIRVRVCRRSINTPGQPEPGFTRPCGPGRPGARPRHGGAGGPGPRRRARDSSQ